MGDLRFAAFCALVLAGCTFPFPNRPPVVRDIQLSPSPARCGDDITATATGWDPDGAIPVLSYQWKRNGELIPGQADPVLHGATKARGDVITAVITAWDGYLSASFESSVTIADTPPTIRAGLTPPGTVAYGDTWTFQVQVDDPDGDPPDAVLEYGPAGMVVAADGTMTWTARPPMFDTSLVVNWSVLVGLSHDVRLTGTIQVTDPARAPPLRRTGFSSPSSPSALVVEDLDGDGRPEMLIGNGSLQVVARSGTGYAQTWMNAFPLGTNALTSVAAVDTDADGKAELFYAVDGALVKLDGATRREVARITLPSLHHFDSLVVADLTGDGAPELLALDVATDSKVMVLDPVTLATEWETARGAYGTSLAVGNVDADPQKEIVTAGGIVLDGNTHAAQWTYAVPFGTLVKTGDVDGDGVEEIAGNPSGYLRVYSAVTQAVGWEIARSSTGSLATADINADGKAEVLAGDVSWLTAYGLNNRNALVALSQVAAQQYGVDAIAAGDLDGDGKVEIAWGSGRGSSGADALAVAGFTTSLQLEWVTANPANLDAPFIGPRWVRGAGGTHALLYGVGSTDSTYAGSRLVSLDPATGLWTTTAELGSNWNHEIALDAADYDGDGVDEAFVATANLYDTYFTAYDVATATAWWTSPTGVGIGKAVAHGDLNGDLTDDFAVIAEDGTVQAYDMKAKALLWKSSSIGTGVDVAITDFDRDGHPDLVALSTAQLVFFRSAPGGTAFEQVASPAISDAVDLLVADVDGDGIDEIYVLTAPFGSTSKVSRFDATGARLASFDLGTSAESLYVEDLGFPRKNLIAVLGSSSIYSDQPSYLVGLDPKVGAEIWRSPGFRGPVPIDSLLTVDTNGDGAGEIAFGAAGGMYLTR